MSTDSKKLKELTDDIVDAAFTVHRELGPGLVESAYEACLAYELELRGRRVERQKVMPVVFKTVVLDCGYRVDMIVDGLVAVELKAVEELHPIYTAQILTYMRLGKFEVGYLMNFNVKLFKDGIHRYRL